MIQKYRIAGLTVAMESFGRTVEQAVPYLCETSAEPDITIKSNWQALKQEAPYLPDEDCEYLSTGGSFYRQLLRYDGMMLHSSAVVLDGYAYLFSAPSGTGKSTHTKQWLRVFGDRAQMLNDDKPALRLEDGRFYAYGTPWSGKYDYSTNMRVPVAGICVLRRGEVNKIEPYSGFKAVHAIMEQTARSRNAEYTEKLLGLIDKLMNTTPVWYMECDISPEAAVMSHKAMSEGIRK